MLIFPLQSFSLSHKSQSGMAIKVLRRKKYRSATIVKEHSDGTYKIKYRDGSFETHVPIERMAISLSQSSLNESGVASPPALHRFASDSSSTSLNTMIEKSFERAFHESVDTYETLKKNYSEEDHPPPIFEDDDEFIVRHTDSLDDWIESDDIGDIPANSDGYFSPKQKISQPENKDFRVVFAAPPLGLTLTQAINGMAQVTKIAPAGQASMLGVEVDDVLIGIENSWIRGFDEAMSTLSKTKFPMTLVFRRGFFISAPSRGAAPAEVTKQTSAHIFTTSIMYAVTCLLHCSLRLGFSICSVCQGLSSVLLDHLGMQKTQSILRTPTERKLSNRHTTARRDAYAHVEAIGGGGVGGGSSEDPHVASQVKRMTTKNEISATPTSDREFDVTFGEVRYRSSLQSHQPMR
jgi:hypothetical protein